jgi:hypothetical protein
LHLRLSKSLLFKFHLSCWMDYDLNDKCDRNCSLCIFLGVVFHCFHFVHLRIVTIFFRILKCYLNFGLLQPSFSEDVSAQVAGRFLLCKYHGLLVNIFFDHFKNHHIVGLFPSLNYYVGVWSGDNVVIIKR